MGIRFENGESRLQGSSDSLPRRMLFSFPMRWDTGVVANQRLGKGEGRAWFDDFPGSDHHGSMCHAHTTTRASRRDVVFTLASFKSSRFLPPQTYQLHSSLFLPQFVSHSHAHSHSHPDTHCLVRLHLYPRFRPTTPSDTPPNRPPCRQQEAGRCSTSTESRSTLTLNHESATSTPSSTLVPVRLIPRPHPSFTTPLTSSPR